MFSHVAYRIHLKNHFLGYKKYYRCFRIIENRLFDLFKTLTEFQVNAVSFYTVFIIGLIIF